MLLLPYAILVRLISFIHPQVYEVQETDGAINEWIFAQLYTPHSQAVVAILLIYIQALLLNRVGIKHKINKEIGLLPGLFFILFSGIIMMSNTLHPVIFANTFIILGLQNIFLTYNRKEASKEVFLSAFYSSLASLFYFPFIYFFVVTTAGLLIMRSFSFKERFQHLIGWTLPYFLLWVWEYWIMEPHKVIPYYFADQYKLIHISIFPTLKHSLLILFLFGSILYFLLRYSTYQSKRLITVQKKIDILYWVLFYGGVTALFYKHLEIEHLITIGLPVGYLFGMSIITIKDNAIQELTHLLMIAFMIYLQFF